MLAGRHVSPRATTAGAPPDICRQKKGATEQAELHTHTDKAVKKVVHEEVEEGRRPQGHILGASSNLRIARAAKTDWRTQGDAGQGGAGGLPQGRTGTAAHTDWTRRWLWPACPPTGTPPDRRTNPALLASIPLGRPSLGRPAAPCPWVQLNRLLTQAPPGSRAVAPTTTIEAAATAAASVPPPPPPEEGGRVAALSEEDVETGQQDSGPAPLCGRTVVIGREGDVQAPYNPHLSRHHIVPTRPGEKWQGLRDTSLDNKHHLA